MEIFSAYGQIKMVDFAMDKLHPNQGRGFAYVEFDTADEAENAMKHMDGGQIDGQEITAAPVLLPKPRPLLMRRMSPGMGRRMPPRWLGGGRNTPPRYRRRTPPMNRRRSPRPPRRRIRTRSRSPPGNPRHRHRRYTRSSTSSSR